jgi:membrane protease subunit HflK
MEKVYSNTSKVMVDVDGGNNMIYLPLDKIMQQQSSSQRATQQSAPAINQSSNSTNTAPALSGRNDRFNNGRD